MNNDFFFSFFCLNIFFGALASLSPCLLHAPHRRKKQTKNNPKHDPFVICHTVKLNKRSTTSHLLVSRGHMCSNVASRFLIGSGSPKTAARSRRSRGSASAYRAHMFGDRWSQRACRDCLRWASHLPLARNRATAGQGLHGGKEESVRVRVQL